MSVTVPPETEAAMTSLDIEAVQEAEGKLNRPFEYLIRFVATQDEDRVVLDRGFSTPALMSASSAEPKKEVIETRWELENPNILTMNWIDGSILEVKVTKRSSSLIGDDGFEFSEYIRLAKSGPDGPMGSVPSLGARRLQCRYRRIPTGEIEGLELLKGYPPVSLRTNPDPIFTTKSRLLLRRA